MSKKKKPKDFPPNDSLSAKRVNVGLPDSVYAAVIDAAQREATTPVQWVRTAISKALRDAGYLE